MIAEFSIRQNSFILKLKEKIVNNLNWTYPVTNERVTNVFSINYYYDFILSVFLKNRNF
jgi:hypothetical protein